MNQLHSARNPAVVTTGLVVVSVVFPLLSLGTILLRLIACRRPTGRLFHADDYWIMISWILTLVLSLLVWVYAAKAGINYYDVDIMTGTEASLELVWLSSVYNNFPLAAVKISILLFYKRIFVTSGFRAVVWSLIGLVTFWCIIFFFMNLFILKPVAFPIIDTTVRFDGTVLGLAQVASSCVLDVIVLCTPIPLIARLNMKLKQKIAVIAVFWLGTFCIIAAIVRTVLLNQSVKGVQQSFEHVFSQSKQYIFMVLEPNVSIMAACLPTYGPLFGKGRGLSAIIMSAFSLFYISSRRSRDNSHQDLQRADGASESTIYRGSSGDSHVDMDDGKDWRGVRQHKVDVTHDTSPQPAETKTRNGISVTCGVSVKTSTAPIKQSNTSSPATL